MQNSQGVPSAPKGFPWALRSHGSVGLETGQNRTESDPLVKWQMMIPYFTLRLKLTITSPAVAKLSFCFCRCTRCCASTMLSHVATSRSASRLEVVIYKFIFSQRLTHKWTSTSTSCLTPSTKSRPTHVLLQLPHGPQLLHDESIAVSGNRS